MKKQTINNLLKNTILTTVALLSVQIASAHISYSGRDFGTFQPGLLDGSVTIANQAVTGNYGWADGTDADFGDSHKTRVFRFTLANPGLVTVTVASSTNGGTKLGNLLPAFSIYSGLAHLPPNMLDHDFSTISQSYLLSLGGVAKEGSFVALGDWKIGSDTGTTFADLSSFTYYANEADGTATNYGSASGINGDGNADGFITGTFYLPSAGDYSIFIGGALVSGTDATGSYGITTTVSVVPEPATLSLIALSSLALLNPFFKSRRNRKGAQI